MLDPTERMTPEEALQHPWILGGLESARTNREELAETGWMLTEDDEDCRSNENEAFKPRASMAYRTATINNGSKLMKNQVAQLIRQSFAGKLETATAESYRSTKKKSFSICVEPPLRVINSLNDDTDGKS